ncbi:MAG TPA: DUF5719 family protein [Mycobacteriales bacterium]|jgi:hypothetical protein|nr:DUF5719 family protein [Mycobacteriales bacterium]
MKRPPFALLSVVVLLGAALAAARTADPAPRRAAAALHETRPVEGSLAVCPELLKSGTDVVTRLTAGVATAGEVSVRAATLVRGSGLGAEVLRSGARVGALRLQSDSSVAAVVTATGPQAGGLEVEQVSRGDDGLHRGWAGTRCEAPSADSWFLGGVTTQGNETQLVLVNPYDDPALVRVEVHGTRGLIDVPELDGIVLGPRARVVRELGSIVPDERTLAVHVLAREGRVAPAVRVARTKGSVPLGVDWLPRLTSAGTQVDVPGIPAGNGARRLFVFAPGEDAVHLRVQFTLADEQFVPDGFDDIEVPPGQPMAFDLTKVLQVVDQRTAVRTQQATALRVFAEGGPVFVAAFAESRATYGPIQELSFVGAAGPLTGPTLVTEARNVRGMNCTLLLSAPDGLARVRVETLVQEGHAGTPVRRVVTVPQGRLVTFSYAKFLPQDALQAVVVTPDTDLAPVYVTRVISEQGKRGPLFTTQALVTQPTAGLDVPFVTADPTAALPAANRRD